MYGLVERVYVSDIIANYLEMGDLALNEQRYSIAYKMFRAAYTEPGAKLQKDKLAVRLLLGMARACEGLKHLYKAKLLYIRALAKCKQQQAIPGMLQVDIFTTLASITAQQGLFPQAIEFVRQAKQTFELCDNQNLVSFTAKLRDIEEIMTDKGRRSEKVLLQSIISETKSLLIAPVSCQFQLVSSN